MKYFLLFILCAACHCAYCQSDLFSSSTNTKDVPTLEAYDITGKRIPTGSQLVAEGNTLINPEFEKGTVILKNGQQYKDVLINFSLTDQELYFKKDSVTMQFYYPVSEFLLPVKDNNDKKVTRFKSGYPVVGSNTTSTFYQVLSYGAKIQFLKFSYKIAREHYEYGGPLKKVYDLQEEFYFYDVRKRTMTPVNTNIKSLKKSIPAYADYIDNYASQKNVKLKREEEIILLTAAINEQPLN